MGNQNYLIDTNISIYYFGLVLSRDSVIFLDEIFKKAYYISVINRIELLGCEGLNKNEYDALETFTDRAIVFELEEAVIRETIRIRQHFKIKLPDAIIAATCLINNCCLITNNIKDFTKIKGLQTHTLELV